MSGFTLFVFVLILMIISVNSYACDCKCCTGVGCSVYYLGTLSVPTCSGTTCTESCQSAYGTCAAGSSSATCSATNIFKFNSILIFLISALTFITFLKNETYC